MRENCILQPKNNPSLWLLFRSAAERFWQAILRVPSVLIIIALAAILCILFYESLFCGKGLVPSDSIFVFLPWSRIANIAPSNDLLVDQYTTFIPQHQFVQQRVLLGDFPLWNPHLNCGLPNLASFQGALLFPIQLILSPIDPFYASSLAAFLKLFLAGLFTILYVRRLGASHVASLLSGLIFSLCGFMIVWLGHPHVNCAMWLPLLLYFIEGQFSNLPQQSRRSIAAVSLRRWAGFAVAYGFMILGGHLPTSFHITIGILGYFSFRLSGHGNKQRLRQAVLLICSILAGLLLAAPQLLPYLEYYRESSSSLSSEALNRWAEHLTPNTLIHFLLPYVSGSPAVGYEDLPSLLGLKEIANFNERSGYVGIVTIFLALFAIVNRRCKFSFFYLVTAILAMLVVYGFPPLPAVMRFLPFVRDINHTRLLMWFAFSFAVLAGLGLTTLSRIERRRKTLFLITGFWTVNAAFLFWFWDIVGQKFSALDGPHQAFLLWQLPVLVGGIIVSSIVALRPKRLGPRFAAFVCLSWTAFDLIWFARGYNPSIPRDRYYPATGVIEFLKKDPSPFRIIGMGNILVPNTALTYGFDDVRGRDFMTVKRYEELIKGKAGDFFFYGFAQSLPRVFPILNVKYVLLPGQIPADTTRFELVYSKEVSVYRFKSCLERALVVFDYMVYRDPEEVLSRVRNDTFDPRQVLLLEEEPKRASAGMLAASSDTVVNILSYEPDDVKIEASLPQPGFLLLLDTYFPGWVASLNGQPTRIYRADYNFRAVSIPAGRSIVRFTYKPKSFRLGLILSLASVVLLITACFWYTIRTHQTDGSRGKDSGS